MAVALCLAAVLFPVQAKAQTASLQADPIFSDTLTVSLITCFPGPEVYELCGHEAIRVRGRGKDVIYNYGVFDFNEPNFVYRFVKGETDYYVQGYPFEWFLPEYIRRGSKVVEQDLNLTPAEADKVYELLHVNALPQNAKYRYNYVKDNCATRIVDILEKGVGQRFVLPDSVRYGTYRKEMREFHKNYPWYQFGIDLALGSGIDYDVTPREEMFTPVVMMRNFEHAELPDGRRIVADTRELNAGTDLAVLPPTPWYLTPMFLSCCILLLTIGICIYNATHVVISRWWYALYFAILGLAGCIIAFLVFFSEHEATSPNILIFWLNPLQLLVPAFIFTRRTRIVATIILWLDIVVSFLMLVIWPMQSQSANPAFFPMLGATLFLSVVYAIITTKSSYNNNLKPAGNLPARSSAKRRSPAKKTTSKSKKQFRK